MSGGFLPNSGDNFQAMDDPMPSDALTTVTNLINSPPGQLAAGGVLAGIVWKFFERVEAVLIRKGTL
jgi:hypothetical protein